jgi:hypothetical protein
MITRTVSARFDQAFLPLGHFWWAIFRTTLTMRTDRRWIGTGGGSNYTLCCNWATTEDGTDLNSGELYDSTYTRRATWQLLLVLCGDVSSTWARWVSESCRYFPSCYTGCIGRTSDRVDWNTWTGLYTKCPFACQPQIISLTRTSGPMLPSGIIYDNSFHCRRLGGLPRLLHRSYGSKSPTRHPASATSARAWIREEMYWLRRPTFSHVTAHVRRGCYGVIYQRSRTNERLAPATGVPSRARSILAAACGQGELELCRSLPQPGCSNVGNDRSPFGVFRRRHLLNRRGSVLVRFYYERKHLGDALLSHRRTNYGRRSGRSQFRSVY